MDFMQIRQHLVENRYIISSISDAKLGNPKNAWIALQDFSQPSLIRH